MRSYCDPFKISKTNCFEVDLEKAFRGEDE
jgi:hypothetical protein